MDEANNIPSFEKDETAGRLSSVSKSPRTISCSEVCGLDSYFAGLMRSDTLHQNRTTMDRFRLSILGSEPNLTEARFRLRGMIPLNYTAFSIYRTSTLSLRT